MGYQVWECKIVVPDYAVIPSGFDSPPRSAAIEAVLESGIEVIECFSGWNGSLTTSENKVIKSVITRPKKDDDEY